MLSPHAESAVAHHAANTAAVVFPISSFVLHLPEALSVTLMIAGLGWYGILYYDRYQEWKKGKLGAVKDTPPDITTPKGH